MNFVDMKCRGRVVGAVQDLIITEMHGKKIVVVLHCDGVLRAWDLSSRSRILSHAMAVPTSVEGDFYHLTSPFFYNWVLISIMSLLQVFLFYSFSNKRFSSLRGAWLSFKL